MFFFSFKTFYSIPYFLLLIKKVFLVHVSLISFRISSVISINFLCNFCKKICQKIKEIYF